MRKNHTNTIQALNTQKNLHHPRWRYHNQIKVCIFTVHTDALLGIAIYCKHLWYIYRVSKTIFIWNSYPPTQPVVRENAANMGSDIKSNYQTESLHTNLHNQLTLNTKSFTHAHDLLWVVRCKRQHSGYMEHDFMSFVHCVQRM